MGEDFNQGQAGIDAFANNFSGSGTLSSSLSSANMSSSFTDAMRSFRDSLAFSFQTLNLTLASLNNSVKNVGTAITTFSNGGPNGGGPSSLAAQYMQVSQPGLYTGSLSNAMGGYLANTDTWGLMRGRVPAGINPLEYYQERNRELAPRIANGMLATGAAAVTTLGGFAVGNKIADIAAGRLTKGIANPGLRSIASTVGSLGLSFPLGTAAAAAIGSVVNTGVDAAIQHNNDIAAVQRMSTRFNSGFNRADATAAMRGIENLAYQDIMHSSYMEPKMGLAGFRELTMMGLQSNMFTGGTRPEDLVKQVSEASKVVKFLAGVMGDPDVKQTMETVKTLKDMGINVFKDSGFATRLGNDAFKLGKATGIDPAQLLNSAANASQAAYGQFGQAAGIGIHSSMRNLAYVQELEKRGMLTPSEIASGGGAQAIGARMTGLQARLENDWNTGKMMVYAGYNGMGFSASQFNKATASGNYWNIMQQGMQNVLGSPVHMMAAEGSFNETLAQAKKSGVLEGPMVNMVGAMLEQALPGLSNGSLNPQERINAATGMIMQMYQVDQPTAKAWANKIYAPDIMKTLNRNGDIAMQQGLYAMAAEENSPFRKFANISDYIDKTKSAVHHTITDPFKRAGEIFTGIVDFTKDTDYILDKNGRYVAPSSIMTENARKAREMVAAGRSVFAQDYRNPDVVVDAYGKFKAGKSYDALNTFFGKNSLQGYTAEEIEQAYNDATSLDPTSRATRLRTAITYNNNVRNAKLYEEISSAERLKPWEFVGKYSDRLSDEVVGRLGSFKSNDKDAISYMLEKAGVEDMAYLYDPRSSRNRSSLDAMRSGALALYASNYDSISDKVADLKSGRFKSLLGSDDTLRNALLVNLKQAGIIEPGMADAMGKFGIMKGLTPDQIVEKLRNGNYKGRLGKLFSKVGLGDNITDEQAIGLLGLGYGKSSEDGDNNDSYQAQIMAIGNGDMIADAARGYALPFGAEYYKKFKEGTLYDMSVSGSIAADLLKGAMGITKDDVTSFLTSKGGTDNFRALAQGASTIAMMQSQGRSEREIAKAVMERSESNPSLRKYYNTLINNKNLYKDFAKSFRDMGQGDLADALESGKSTYGNERSVDDDAKAIIQQTFGGVLLDKEQKQHKGLLEMYGANLSDTVFDSKDGTKNYNFYDWLRSREGKEGTLRKDAQRLLGWDKHLRSLSDAEFEKEVKRVVGEENYDKFISENGDRDAQTRQLVTSFAMGKKQNLEDENAKNKDKINSTVDTAIVKDSKGKPAMNVVLSENLADKGRTMATENTQKPNTKGVGEPVVIKGVQGGNEVELVMDTVSQLGE